MKRIALIAAMACLALVGCEAEYEPYRISVYSGGVLVQEWTSTSRPSAKAFGRIKFFRDNSTGEIVAVPKGAIITKRD